MEYLTFEEVVEINKLVLQEVAVRKADQPKLLSVLKLGRELEQARNAPGDVYGKAVTLVTGTRTWTPLRQRQ